MMCVLIWVDIDWRYPFYNPLVGQHSPHLLPPKAKVKLTMRLVSCWVLSGHLGIHTSAMIDTPSNAADTNDCDSIASAASPSANTMLTQEGIRCAACNSGRRIACDLNELMDSLAVHHLSRHVENARNVEIVSYAENTTLNPFRSSAVRRVGLQ